MEKLTKVKIMLLDGSKIEAKEAMDIGNYYYLLGVC